MVGSVPIRRFRSTAALAAWIALAVGSLPCSAFDDASPQPVDAYSELPVPQIAAPPTSISPASESSMSFADEEPPVFSPQAFSSSPDSNVRLIDRVTDPTEWLQEHRFRESWNWPLQNDVDNQEFQFRSTVPFRLWEHVNILRITIPFDISGEGGQGLKEVRLLDLVVFEEEWGRWGVGPVVEFKPANGADEETFFLGPAAGAVTKNEHWTVGLLNQNLLADDSSQTRLQPILAYKFNDQWALGVGEFEFRYDWDESRWTQVPLGLQLECIADVYGERIQLFANPQYNFISDASNSGWTIFLGISLLVPDA